MSIQAFGNYMNLVFIESRPPLMLSTNFLTEQYYVKYVWLETGKKEEERIVVPFNQHLAPHSSE